jgi:ubiquitin-protein ligase
MRLKWITNVGGILIWWFLVNSSTASSTNHNKKNTRRSSGLSPATASPGTTVFHAARAATLQSSPFLGSSTKVVLQIVPQHALSFRGGGSNKNKNSPTTGTGSKKLAQQTSQEAATLRRIKREYKDAVQMGIGYNWALGEPIRRPNKNKTKKNKAKSSKDLTIEEVEEEEDEEGTTRSTTSTTMIDDILYPLRLGPLVTNLRHWHFTFQGCGVYENGLYHGRIILPKDYPASPPRVQMWTPSGRFKSGHDICLSASSYHPESWTPRWTVVSLVHALRLHMLTTGQEIGGLTDTTYEETMEYARNSLTWRCSWNVGGKSMKVDHAQMIQQGAIVLPKPPQQPVTATTTTASHEEQQKEGENEEENEPIIVKDNDDTSTISFEETNTATTPVVVGEDEMKRLPPHEQGTNSKEDVALEEHSLAPKRRKTKSRKIKSTTNAGTSLSWSSSGTTTSTARPHRPTSSAVTTKRKSNHQQQPQRKAPIPTDDRSILLFSISKWLFAAPIRLAIVSLIFLFVMLNRP